jgi:hypothetical protein
LIPVLASSLRTKGEPLPDALFEAAVDA